MPQKQVLTVLTVHVSEKNAEVPQAHAINKMVKVPVIMVTQLPAVFFFIGRVEDVFQSSQCVDLIQFHQLSPRRPSPRNLWKVVIMNEMQWQVAIFFRSHFLFQLITRTFKISWRADLLGLVRLFWIAARAVPDARTLISSRDRFPDAGTFFFSKKKSKAFNQTPEIKGGNDVHAQTSMQRNNFRFG